MNPLFQGCARFGYDFSPKQITCYNGYVRFWLLKRKTRRSPVKEKTANKKSDSYLHTYHIVHSHEAYLSDVARNRSFVSALTRHVKPGSTVLDIGSGTGIWAITAALLGARRVVAIERDELLIPIIRNLIKENGVSDRVEVIHGESQRINLDERFDCIVSETIGNQAFEEQIVSTMTDARKRFLKPGGVLIPSFVSLVVATAHMRRRPPNVAAGASVKCEYFELLSLNIPVTMTQKSKIRVISTPKDLLSIDLLRVDAMPDLASLTARWNNIDLTRINCFAVWAEMRLAKGLKLSTLETSNWAPVIYQIKPFKRTKGNVEFVLNMTDKTHYWTASLSNSRDTETQSYSPVFAYTSLQTQLRMAEAFNTLKKG